MAKKAIAAEDSNFDETVEIPKDEVLFAVPTSEVKLIEYMEDKYSVFKNKDEEYFAKISQKVKDNGNHCPCSLQKTPDTLCMCKEFKLQDKEGFCHCKRYYKELNTEEKFRKMRIASFKRKIH